MYMVMSIKHDFKNIQSNSVSAFTIEWYSILAKRTRFNENKAYLKVKVYKFY